MIKWLGGLPIVAVVVAILVSGPLIGAWPTVQSMLNFWWLGLVLILVLLVVGPEIARLNHVMNKPMIMERKEQAITVVLEDDM